MQSISRTLMLKFNQGSCGVTACRTGKAYLLGAKKTSLGGVLNLLHRCVSLPSIRCYYCWLLSPAPRTLDPVFITTVILVFQNRCSLDRRCIHDMGYDLLWAESWLEASQVILEDVRVPERFLIGKEGQGFTIAMSALDGGRINIATCRWLTSVQLTLFALSYGSRGPHLISNQY